MVASHRLVAKMPTLAAMAYNLRWPSATTISSYTNFLDALRLGVAVS